MSSGEFLLEVRTEEIPARMLPGAIKELGTRIFEELMARGVPPTEIETGFTPRRLWLVMKELPEKEMDQRIPLIGPPVATAFDVHGKPTVAAEGFAKRLGLDVGALKRREFSPGVADADLLLQEDAVTLSMKSFGGDFSKPKPVKVQGEYVYVLASVPGRKLRDLLAEMLPTALEKLSWAKSMTWGSGIGPWVRPVHGVVALLDGEVVPFMLFDVASGRETAGHPRLSPERFTVAGAADWRARLAALGIVPELEERERRLRSAMEERSRGRVGELVDDPELLSRLAAVCEIPGVVEGEFDPSLLELPREVLVTSLRDHQSALTIEREGEMLPVFLTVMDRADDPIGRVRAGNEWVVAARLADARFFWIKDHAVPLAERVPALADLGFHQQLGTYAGKRDRLISLCAAVARWLNFDPEETRALDTAASLAKADLTTEMVREFTSLQGVMGGVYAREEGQPEEVWTAVYDQYQPAGADDPLPRARLGRILALADRVDSLVGFFALGAVPTGSRDPFGLRRAALGVVRLVLEFDTRIDLGGMCESAYSGYAVPLPKSKEATWALLRPFLEDRLRFLLERDGFAYDEVEAALQREGETLAYLGPLRARVAAIHAARSDPDFLSVVLAAKRLHNITRDQKRSPLDASRLQLAAERDLHAAARALDDDLAGALARGDFAAGIGAVARLASALERFFDEVLVMDPDEGKRTNRLALLQSLGASISRLADLSQLAIDKAELRRSNA